MNAGLFDRARDAVALEDYAGKLVTLRKAGPNELRGPCPLCDPQAKHSTKFKISVDRQTWFCFGCERRGDVVDLHAEVCRLDLVEAARELGGPGAQRSTAKPRPAKPSPIEDADRQARILRMAADMWFQSADLIGTPGFGYLVGRGIEPELVAQAAGKIHFHKAAPHSWNPEAREWRAAPALVIRIMCGGAWTGGVHVTYLTPDGLAKSKTLSPAKRMWGPQGIETPLGRRRGGAWLVDPDVDADMVVGEGVETSLSLATWLWRRGKRDFHVAAALSLGALEGGQERDGDGCVDVWRPKGDPQNPPFLLDPCNTGPKTPCGALIAIDRDMAPIKVRGRNGRGKVVDFELDAEARAKRCAILATAAWRSAGWAFARPMYPAPNGDWNDHIKAGATA